MASELERALVKAKYTALPLPRGKAGPTTIYSFHRGQLFIVRNAQTCLKFPVTSDPSVDTVRFTQAYKLNVSGVVGFLLKLFGIGSAKAELEMRSIKTATVQMGGLSHDTIETGGLLDHLLKEKPSACLRDILDSDNLTIIAALKANTFTFSFRTEKGTAVKLSLPEATGLFKADASVGVEVAQTGEVVVNSPSYVGVITWDGGTVKRELEKARRYAKRPALRAYAAPVAVSVALAPEEIEARRLKSLGIRPATGRTSRVRGKGR